MTDQGPTLTQPEPPAPPIPTAAAPKLPTKGIAIAALAVGGAAFLFGLVPVFGLLLALAGLAIGIIALVTKATPKWMPLVGTIAAGVALLASIGVLAGLGAISNLANDTPSGARPEIVVPAEPEEVEEPAEPVEPEEPAAPDMTLGQEQAAIKAESYLAFMGFSRSGLIEQLKFEQFSTADSTFAVDYLDPDWNEQAAIKAESYMELGGFSKASLIEQLKFEGFTSAEAAFGAASVGY